MRTNPIRLAPHTLSRDWNASSAGEPMCRGYFMQAVIPVPPSGSDNLHHPGAIPERLMYTPTDGELLI